MVGSKKKNCYTHFCSLTVTTTIPLHTNPTTDTPAINRKGHSEEEKYIHPAPLPIYIPRPIMEQPVLPSMDMRPPLPVLVSTLGKKNDDFYKYWDRFTRVKEKKDAQKTKASKKAVVKEAKEDKNKAKTELGSNDEERIAEGRAGPSLDKDVEGRPGHPMVRSNTEGVVSRCVRFD